MKHGKAAKAASALLSSFFVVTTAVGFTVAALAIPTAGAVTHHHRANVASTPAPSSSGTAPAAQATAKSAPTGPATFQVCKVAGDPSLVNQSFPFIEVNWSGGFGAAYSLSAQPSPGGCGQAVTLSAGAMVIVEEASSPGIPFPGVTPTFSVSGGTISGTMANISLVAVTLAPGANRLTVTNRPTPTNQTGQIELCKYGDTFVQGNTFTFTVTPTVNRADRVQHVLAGQCNNVAVPAGNVSIQEQASFPYTLSSVNTLPPSALVSVDRNTQTAVVSVPPTGDVPVFVTNSTLTGFVKVCKTLARPEDNVLAGKTFTYTVTGSFQGSQILNTTTSVVAAAFPTTTCTYVANFGGPIALPLGTLVTIHEQGTTIDTPGSFVQVVGTTVSPSNLDAGSTLGTARLYVGNLPAPHNIFNFGAGSTTSATFTNEALGAIEICKMSKSINGGTPFSFTVGGSIQTTVNVGLCGGAIVLPVGTTTITENVPAHVTLTKVTTTIGRPSVSGNTVTVTVPFGGTGFTNTVTFWDEINTGTLKLCKDNSDGTLSTDSFNLSLSYTLNGTPHTVSGSVMPTGCLPSPPANIPVLNGNLTPVTITVTEGVTTLTDVGVVGFSVFGPDTVIGTPPATPHNVGTPGGTPYSVNLTSTEGNSEAHFNNGTVRFP